MDIGNWDDDDSDTSLQAGPAPKTDAEIDSLIQFTDMLTIPDEDENDVDLPPLPPGVVDVTGDHGVLLEMHGEASTGEKPCKELPYVEMHYDGYLVSNGEKFDSSRDQNYAMISHLDIPPSGRSALIPGLEVGLQALRAGERATLTVKSRYAYGKAGAPEIPPNSDLRFVVEVIDVRASHRRVTVVDESQNDLSRLEDVRRQRETAQLRREEETIARDAEKQRKADRVKELREKLANKNKGKKGGKKKK